MAKNLKFDSMLRRRAQREDTQPWRYEPSSVPIKCGTSPEGWPVHVYRLNARVGDRCLCGMNTLDVAGSTETPV